jgi:hypothetical protein
MQACPPECQEDRERHSNDIDKLYEMAIPSWVRVFIFSAIGLLFTLYFVSVVKAFDVFQTKESAIRDRAQVESTLAEIRADVKTLLMRPHN